MLITLRPSAKMTVESVQLLSFIRWGLERAKEQRMQFIETDAFTKSISPHGDFAMVWADMHNDQKEAIF
ncbi:uncharacterized protein PHALS_14957 [Plasmopara halstedii]|uniref:Uncharacterized protein n=1 Tax=Plasmopara halstedii TaxID=4781 RepID=A0A0P1AX91_PLAHL|nr:uncharacterized protein PHALS_14957 [Plasmopara halstedii]CEG47041.1 hypothetical protein PHALS_14957 [Plasmopara halstedii]|eukprot:XP_024583410.1 hypothetical protein PHALS_14957 [Plasmopara halstedii]